ncbi:sensor histidine kinase [Tenacibaculum amylolyticum]|uniref:sensor histidine kinase n=1 Tax=Tenacibaculum amylolyticum TaxID=104269 RepID=UPI0038940696
MKNSILKKYKALLLGGIITIGLTFLIGNGIGFFIVNPIYVSNAVYILINTVAVIIIWLLLSFLINKFKIYKILVVVGMFVATIIIENYLHIKNGIITVPLIILFWLGITYFIIPEFFNKYKLFILTIYGLIICYYLIFRILNDYGTIDRLEFFKYVLIPIPFFGAVWLYEQWRWLQMLRMDKSKAELALLKSQINPHFFFNTLNNLYGLVVEKSDDAPEVVLKLSDMMRYTIYEGKEEYVNLSDEIAYLQTYIELHKIRYHKKVIIQFVQEIEKDVKIAPLLFILLLENAFKHGVEKLAEDAYIHLEIKSRAQVIECIVENNYEANNSFQKKGIGLDNLRRRLMHIYPNKHTFRVEKRDNVYKAYLKIILN